MFTTRQSGAKLRYNLLTVCLGLFVLSIGYTFYVSLDQPTNIATKVTIDVGNQLTAHINNQSELLNVPFNLSDPLKNILSIWNTYANQIVLVWFLIICGKSIKLIVGLNDIYHLKKHQTYAAGKKWDERVGELSNKLGLQQSVRLLQSGIAKVPMAVGHFKPLILIPIGLLNAISVAEVDAILSHELAHIKRRDYLVNLLQSFIEIAFFFNPAVLWVSQLIKTEREHCCDDLAIACVNDRKNYVKALIFCQEFKQGAPAYAMGIMGKKGSLLLRASRMLFNTNSTLNKMEKTILTVALVLTVLCTIAFKNAGNAATITKNRISNKFQSIQDTTKKTSDSKSADRLEKEIQDKIKVAEEKSKAKTNNRLTKKQHQDLGEETLKQAKLDAEQTEQDAKRVEADAKYAEKSKKYAEAEARYKAEEIEYAKAQKKWAEEDAKWAEENKKGNLTPRAPRPPRPARVRSAPVPPIPNVARVPAMPNVPPAPAMPPAPPLPPKRSSTSYTKTEVNHSAVSTTVKDGNDFTTEMNKQLLKEGIITDTKKLSYSLNKDELVVNSVKQSDEIQKKYKKMFLKSDKHSLSYSSN